LLLLPGDSQKCAGGYLSASVLSGLLGNRSKGGDEGARLNLVSAPALAKQLGIKVGLYFYLALFTMGSCYG